MKEDLIRLLDNEMVWTSDMIEKVNAMLKNAPPGELRVIRHHTNYQYYHLGNPASIQLCHFSSFVFTIQTNAAESKISLGRLIVSRIAFCVCFIASIPSFVSP